MRSPLLASGWACRLKITDLNGFSSESGYGINKSTHDYISIRTSLCILSVTTSLVAVSPASNSQMFLAYLLLSLLSAFDAHRSRHTQTARPATVQRLQKRFSMKKRFYCRKKFSRVTPSFFDSLRYSSSAIQQRNDLFAVRIDRAWILSFGSILHLKGNVIPSLSVDLL